MTRIHSRTVLANFEDLGRAREAARRIRREGLGQAQVDALTDHVGDPTWRPGDILEPLAGPDMDLVSDVLGDSNDLLAKRPRLDESVLLTVVTEEAKVRNVVSIIKASGGSV